ncbi:hypothetical protein L1887_54668 [Cichorium endivia]|nr:hypothetical protein L1887_54668 [Cichorium endivia]
MPRWSMWNAVRLAADRHGCRRPCWTPQRVDVNLTSSWHGHRARCGPIEPDFDAIRAWACSCQNRRHRCCRRGHCARHRTPTAPMQKGNVAAASKQKKNKKKQKKRKKEKKAKEKKSGLDPLPAAAL